MDKSIKEGLINLIFGNENNKNKDPLGIQKIIQSVDVSDYQKKRYFFYVCKVIVPLFIGVKDDEGYIDANKIIPVAYEVAASWRGYKIQSNTYQKCIKPLKDIEAQIYLHNAANANIKEAEKFLRAIEHCRIHQSQLSFVFGEFSDKDYHLEQIIKDRLSNETHNRHSITPERRLEMLLTKGNSFNDMPLNDVYKHFGELSKQKNKDGQPYLSEDQVLDFIEKAFCNIEHPEIKINIGTRENMKIWNFFHQFYVYAYTQLIETTSHCRDKYIGLLTDNFTNFEFIKVKDSFNKKPKTMIFSDLKAKQQR